MGYSFLLTYDFKHFKYPPVLTHSMEHIRDTRVIESTSVFKSAKYLKLQEAQFDAAFQVSGAISKKSKQVKLNSAKHYVIAKRIPGDNFLGICQKILPTRCRRWAIVFSREIIYIKWIAHNVSISRDILEHLREAIDVKLKLLSMTGVHEFHHMFDGYAQQLYYCSE